MNKRKGYRAGTSSVRKDYRKGGRVKFVEGGEPNLINLETELDSFGIPVVRDGDPEFGSALAAPTQEELDTQREEEAVVKAAAEILEREQETRSENRRERIARTGAQAEQIAAGDIGNIPKVDVEKVSLTDTEVDAQTIASREGVEAASIAQPTTEQVSTASGVDTIDALTPITAGTMAGKQVTTAPTVTAAQTTVDDNALATTAGVSRIPTIQGADVTIKQGALTERVVGVLSPEAMSTAAQASGTTLARVSRAKKQLRNSGLDEAAITALGENPEALEDRLTDFTEAQRGVIEGLPEEALVSNQIDSLLVGIQDGNIPTWASPAVAAVEQMLAQRGLDSSTVGRDNLVNAIIQSAVPIAQANAQAIQQSVAQEKTLIAQEALANAQFTQQTALSNADKVFQLNIAQFNADQQTALSNSKFLQTVSLTEASNDQQATIQNAVLMSQANLAEADFTTKLAITNAQTFLQTDLANLNATQQVNILKAQQQQQTLLSNQSAANVAAQFNATSENQTNQYMASLAAQIDQYNASQNNANLQFNAQATNAAAARDAQRVTDVNKANAAIVNQVAQFNEQMDFNREQWNSANAQAVANSNIDWRRKANLADTAAQNAVNQQNVANAFQLSTQAQAFLWQELRDQADYDFKFADNTASRKIQAMVSAAGTEGEIAKRWATNFTNIQGTVEKIFGGDYTSTN
tara:strand:- start:4565 stop:6649 length:2085 start_codon:yes stop_codon:yes gene_type:complete